MRLLITVDIMQFTDYIDGIIRQTIRFEFNDICYCLLKTTIIFSTKNKDTLNLTWTTMIFVLDDGTQPNKEHNSFSFCVSIGTSERAL